LVIVLGVIIILLVLFPRVKKNEVVMITPSIVIETVVTPVTENKVETSRLPTRPSLPFPSDEPDLSPDITLEPITFGTYKPWDNPPPPKEEPRHSSRLDTFKVYDKAPEPIGGYAAIQKNLIYPPMARDIGIEGKVIIRAFVSKDGEVTECSVLQGMPDTGLEEAAIAAIKKTRFIPAQQRDRKIGVYIAIPVVFKLKY